MDINFKKNSMLDLNNDKKYHRILKNHNSDNRISDITICIPTFNRLDNFKLAFESAINQTASGYKILVCIDGVFKEDYINFLTYFVGNNIDFEVYFNEENLGMFSNWNRLLGLVDSKYCTFLHDDDLLSADFINCARKALNTKISADAVVFKPNIVNHMKKRSPLRLFSYFSRPIKQLKIFDFLEHFVTNGLGMVVRTQVFKDLGGYDSNLGNVYSGVDYITHAILAAEYKMFFYSKKLNYYNYKNKLHLEDFKTHVANSLVSKNMLLDYYVQNETQKKFYRFLFIQQSKYSLLRNYDEKIDMSIPFFERILAYLIVFIINLKRELNI